MLLSKQTGEPSFFLFSFFFIIAFNSISLLSPFFSFLFLGQANVRSVPSIASSLESKDSEGGCRSSLLCFLFFLFFLIFFMPFPCLLLLWRSPPASLPSFSCYTKVSSPFLQLAICPFLESSKKLEEQEEEVPPQEADTGFPFFLLLFFLPPFPPPPFFFN